jgi:predicted nucleic acid-binding protein
MKLIFDSSALIPASKYAVEGRRICEHLVEYVEIHIPIAVAEETVVHPDKFASEALLQNLISQRKIIVNAVHPTSEEKEVLAGYKLGPGEQEAILLYWQNPEKFDSLVLDDYVATIVCRRLQVDSMLLLDLIVHLGREGMMPRDLAVEMISKVAPRYNLGFIEHSLTMLGEHKVGEVQAPYYVTQEDLDRYISGKFLTVDMSQQEVDLWRRLAQCYKEYAEGNVSLSWMAEYLHISVHAADALLERMKLPVATGINKLASRSDFRGELVTQPKKYKTLRRRPTNRQKPRNEKNF